MLVNVWTKNEWLKKQTFSKNCKLCSLASPPCPPSSPAWFSSSPPSSPPWFSSSPPSSPHPSSSHTPLALTLWLSYQIQTNKLHAWGIHNFFNSSASQHSAPRWKLNTGLDVPPACQVRVSIAHYCSAIYRQSQYYCSLFIMCVLKLFECIRSSFFKLLQVS